MNNFTKCDKCDKESTYDSPANYCDEHWREWWFFESDEPLEDQEKETLRRSIIKELKLAKEAMDALNRRYKGLE